VSQPPAGAPEPRSARATLRGTGSLLRGARPSAAVPLLLVSGAAAGAFSVPRYDVRIVGAYLGLLAVLLLAVTRGLRRPPAGPPLTRATAAAALLAGAWLVWAVPAFTYLTGTPAATLRAIGVGGALAAAGLLALPWRRGPDAALVVAVACYAATAAAALRLDPAPRIDVWYILQGAADGLRHGADMYRQVWIGPPGPMPFFTYLPWTAVLLAPARWLFGDVRWMLVLITLGTVVLIRRLPGAAAGDAAGPAAPAAPAAPAGPVPGIPPDGATTTASPPATTTATSAAAAATLLVLLPGTLTQVEQAWTEPLLLGCLTLTMFALTRRNGLLAVVGLALALASKQHILLLLPVFAAWPRFGPRRAGAAALFAGVLVLPWFAADPGAMWHDTVTLLVNFPALRFADTAYIAVLNEWGVQLPFWLTGALVLVTVAAAAVVVRRHNPPPAALLRWCALVLLVANLVNKQAFYNQYWLVAGLVLLSWAVPPTTAPGRRAPAASAATPSTALQVQR
jgi:hypothetical protein